jgi:drug/metabolite transporter (DMT)-like permease
VGGEGGEGQRRNAGVAALVLTTAIWSAPPLILKQTALQPLDFAAYRLWAGVAIYAVIFAFTGRRLRWATLKACAPGGVLFAADVALSFTAFRLTSVVDSTIIGSLATVVIIIGAARWFGEHMERSDGWFVAAALVGVAAVAIGSSGESSFSLAGDLFAVVGIFSWTGYWLFSKKARANATAFEYMATVMLVAAIVMTALVPLTGHALTPPHGSDWLRVWGVALFAGAVGHSLLAWSHQHVPAWMGALILECQPAVSTVLAWIVLHESVGPVTAAGGALVVGDTATLVIRAGRRDPAEFDDAEPTNPVA